MIRVNNIDFQAKQIYFIILFVLDVSSTKRQTNKKAGCFIIDDQTQLTIIIDLLTLLRWMLRLIGFSQLQLIMFSF